ncbi:MAG: hypothetical protein Phyf2KO_16870 [Phycisphaerales bacterium]
MPKRNTEFWQSKIAANSERDKRKASELEAMGYTVITIWECEAVSEALIQTRLRPLCTK